MPTPFAAPRIECTAVARPSAEGFRRSGSARRAFSLVELLVVIAIIAVLTGLLVPGLIAARNAARKSSTSALMNTLSSSIAQYKLDNDDAAPGYFTPSQMGDPANANRGMTMNENILLGLAGAQAINDPGTNPQSVGPFGNAAENVDVDINKIGLGSNVYLKVSPENLLAVDPTLQGGEAPHVTDTSDPQMPDIVDAWQRPLLFWVADEFVDPSQIAEADPSGNSATSFARVSSTDGPALFYWNSNKGYLDGPLVNQTDLSLLGGSVSETARRATMRALLGSTGYPNSLDPTAEANVYPTAARNNGIVMQSAGADLVYLGINDRGTKQNGFDVSSPASVRVEYGSNFFSNGERILDNERETTIDIMKDFDDIIGG